MIRGMGSTSQRENALAAGEPSATITVRSGAKVSVLEVPPGSVIVLKDVLLSDPDDVEYDANLRQMIATLYEALGHKQFAVITIEGDSDVQWGPDADLKGQDRFSAWAPMKLVKDWLAAPPRLTFRSIAWVIYVVWMVLSIIGAVENRHFYVAALQAQVITLLLFLRWMMAEIDRQDSNRQ